MLELVLMSDAISSANTPSAYLRQFARIRGSRPDPHLNLTSARVRDMYTKLMYNNIPWLKENTITKISRTVGFNVEFSKV